MTICTRDRVCLFGEVLDGEMQVNQHGQIAGDEWYLSADLRDELTLDAFVVMPNHIHGIVFIDGPKGDPPVAPTLGHGPRPRSLGSFIAGYKSSVSRRIVHAQTGVGATGGSPSPGKRPTVWQRDHNKRLHRDAQFFAPVSLGVQEK